MPLKDQFGYFLRSFSFSLPFVLTNFMSTLLRRFSIVNLIYSFAEILHCLSEDRAVHQFVKIFFECRLGFFAQFCVEADI